MSGQLQQRIASLPWDQLRATLDRQGFAQTPVLLSAGDRYKELVRRVKAGHGKFDAESARHLMDRPVAMKSNLHSVLFETTTGRFWVANASKDGQPAVLQPFHAFDLPLLLKHQPDTTTPSLPAPPAAATISSTQLRNGTATR